MHREPGEKNRRLKVDQCWTGAGTPRQSDAMIGRDRFVNQLSLDARPGLRVLGNDLPPSSHRGACPRSAPRPTRAMARSHERHRAKGSPRLQTDSAETPDSLEARFQLRFSPVLRAISRAGSSPRPARSGSSARGFAPLKGAPGTSSGPSRETSNARTWAETPPRNNRRPGLSHSSHASPSRTSRPVLPDPSSPDALRRPCGKP